MEPPKRDMHWPTVLWYIHLHALGGYGLFLLFAHAKWLTVFYAIFVISIAILGITVGAHRLWAHRAFTASTPLRFFLMMAHTLAGVGPIHDWALMHRIHHKFYGTDKDPHNHKKGFYYSHVISNLLTEHSQKQEIERDIDMRDLESDGFVWFQRKLYWLLFPIFGLLLPLNAPVEYWDESILNAVFITVFLRLAITVNASWLVNSAMLIWGMKPGDKYPADDNTIFWIHKSYWPNYHYLLPWDWKCGEYGGYESDWSTVFIKLMESMDCVTTMKTSSNDDIRDALYELATSKKTLEECFEQVAKAAETEALKKKLSCSH